MEIHWRLFGDVFLAMTATGDVSDEATRRLCEAVRKHKPKTLIAYALAPTKMAPIQQRKMMMEAAKASGTTVFMISDSPLVRGAIAAASWIGVKSRAFPPTQIREAAEAAGLDANRQRELMSAVNELRAIVITRKAI